MKANLVILAAAVGLAILGLAWLAAPGSPEGAAVAGRAGTTSETRRDAASLASLASAAEGNRAPRAVRVGAGSEGPFDANAGPGPSAKLLVGRVVDARGGPLTGALVTASTLRSSFPLGLEDDQERRSAGEGIVEVVSDADGHFEVQRGERATPLLAPGRSLRLLARAPGHVPTRPNDVRMSVDLPHDAGDIVLVPGQRAEGRVLGPAGKPLEGVRLSFGQPDLSGLMTAVVPTRGLEFTRTGEDGRYVCDELRPGRFWIIAELPGYALASVEGTLLPGASGRGFDIRMRPAATIAGRIEGLPEGTYAFVAAAARRQDDVPALERRWRTIAVDPASGLFRGDLFVAGIEYELVATTAYAEDARPRLTRAVEATEVFAPATDVVLQWDPRTSVVGRVVTTGPDGDLVPVEGFMVASTEGDQRGNDFDARTLRAGDEPQRRFPGGVFRFPDLGGRAGAERQLTFRVRAVGYGDLFVRGVDVPHGETTDLGDLVLTPGPTLSVKVVAGDPERPVAGARVFAVSAANDRWFERWRGRDEPAWESDTVRYGESGPDGIATLPQPPEKGPVKVAANADGFVPSEVLETAPSGEVAVLRLVRGATVLAAVTTPRGKPAAGVEVTLASSERGRRGRATARTDAAGEARFEAVEAGRYELRSQPPNMRPRAPIEWVSAGASVDVPAAGEVRVALVAQATTAVPGRVLEAGAPLEGARLEFAVRQGEELLRPDWRAPELRAITDADGRFRLESVPVGTYLVGVSHRERAMTARFEIDIPEECDTVTLSLPEATLSGRVVDRRSGTPYPNVRVSVRDAVGEDRTFIGDRVLLERADGGLDDDTDWYDPGRTRADDGGRFAFRGVGVGKPLVIEVEGDFVRTNRFEVGPLAVGESRDGIEVPVAGAGALTVSIERDAPSSQRVQVRVQRLGADGEPRGRPQAQTERRAASFGGLAPGRYLVETLEASRGGQGELIATEEVTVVAGKRIRIALRGE